LINLTRAGFVPQKKINKEIVSLSDSMNHTPIA